MRLEPLLKRAAMGSLFGRKAAGLEPAPGVPLNCASIRAANADAREGKDFASIGINDARTAPVPTVGIKLISD